jgi:hypothetical protein
MAEAAYATARLNWPRQDSCSFAATTLPREQFLVWIIDQRWIQHSLTRLSAVTAEVAQLVSSDAHQGLQVAIATVLSEQHHERQVARRYFSAESLAKLRKETPAEPPPVLLAAG